MKYGKGFKTSLVTVLMVVGLGILFSILSKNSNPSSQMDIPQYTDRQIVFLQRYLRCEPYIGWNNLYRVWRREAQDAVNFKIYIYKYQIRKLAYSLAPVVGTSPNDPDLVRLVTILTLRDVLIQWYSQHLNVESLRLFQLNHVGFLQWQYENKCVDYSFLPTSYLPYHLKDIDVLSTWREAQKRGLETAGYVDGMYMKKVMFKQ